MVKVYCSHCQDVMYLTHKEYLFAPSPDDFVCDVCVSHNEEVSSWYEYDDYELAYAGFEEQWIPARIAKQILIQMTVDLFGTDQYFVKTVTHYLKENK